jgi:hypothetical protein
VSITRGSSVVESRSDCYSFVTRFLSVSIALHFDSSVVISRRSQFRTA